VNEDIGEEGLLNQSTTLAAFNALFALSNARHGITLGALEASWVPLCAFDVNLVVIFTTNFWFFY